MSGYNYSNNFAQESTPTLAYCEEQLAMYRQGLMTAKECKAECLLMGYKVNLKTGEIKLK